MGNIAKIMEESGFEDCLIEAGVYTDAVISKLWQEKCTIEEFELINCCLKLYQDSNEKHLFLGQREMIYILTMSIENYF